MDVSGYFNLYPLGYGLYCIVLCSSTCGRRPFLLFPVFYDTPVLVCVFQTMNFVQRWPSQGDTISTSCLRCQLPHPALQRTHLKLYRAVLFLPSATGRLVLHLLGQLGVVLLEAVADALLGGHPLEDAAVDAAVFARGEGLGGEVVDAGGEAVVDEAAESLVRVSRVLVSFALCHRRQAGRWLLATDGG